MLDTADKRAPGCSTTGSARLAPFRACLSRVRNLLSGLAGALEAPDVPRLLVLEPGLLGFRGALCGVAGRTGAIDRRVVQEIRALIPLEAGRTGRDGVDYRLLAARGYAPDRWMRRRH